MHTIMPSALQLSYSHYLCCVLILCMSGETSVFKVDFKQQIGFKNIYFTLRVSAANLLIISLRCLTYGMNLSLTSHKAIYYFLHCTIYNINPSLRISVEYTGMYKEMNELFSLNISLLSIQTRLCNKRE